jgi:hypothetical protein
VANSDISLKGAGWDADAVGVFLGWRIEAPDSSRGSAMSQRHFRLAGAVLAAAGAVVFGALPAGATTATATVTGGSLGFVSAPASTGFSVSLTGKDVVATATTTFDVGDATGAGTGWNITATSTSFTAGSHSLPTSAVTVLSLPTVASDTGATCTTATNGISYPYTLPAGTTAPTATKLSSAAANTGLGNQTVSVGFQLAVSANAYAGNYTSTWTYSLVSGP